MNRKKTVEKLKTLSRADLDFLHGAVINQIRANRDSAFSAVFITRRESVLSKTTGVRANPSERWFSFMRRSPSEWNVASIC